VSLYLDTSFIVAISIPDALSARAEQFLLSSNDVLIVSDFAAAEFASVISRRRRIKTFNVNEARDALNDFDTWLANAGQRTEVEPVDIALADSYLRRLDLTLLAPDAIHIAITERLGAILVTFDRQMATAARALGVPVAAD
jgi:predicted nucleic acid-binding protein